jgi:hypothetical protein
VAFTTKDWQELYEGAREAFGAARAAIFMRAVEPTFRDDLVTKDFLRAALAEQTASFEAKLRVQTWTIATLFVAVVIVVLGITGLTG